MNCNVLYGNVDTSEGGRDGWVSGTSAHIMPMYVFLLKKNAHCAHLYLLRLCSRYYQKQDLLSHMQR